MGNVDEEIVVASPARPITNHPCPARAVLTICAHNHCELSLPWKSRCTLRNSRSFRRRRFLSIIESSIQSRGPTEHKEYEAGKDGTYRAEIYSKNKWQVFQEVTTLAFISSELRI